jgi:transposase/acyl-coenzyme A thioesterase PaaI-like protein
MLTQEDDVDAHALRKRGWSISAIARHLGHDRKTIRAYLNDERVAGVRAPAGEDRFVVFVDYCRARLVEDPHLWAMTLFDEVVALGFDRSYPTFTRQLRARELRPHCEACSAATGRPVAIIEHPPGEETQWDWVDLPDPPASWGWGTNASLFVGALAHSGKWRGQLAESKDQPHTIDALDRISRALGGLTQVWRFDRMATVCHPATGRLTASFAGVAKHYGVSVAICPPRRGNRKGVVEKANHTAAQRWWRTLPDDITIEAAQASLDVFCVRVVDTRRRVIDGRRDTVAAHASGERLIIPPAPFPATLTVERAVSAQALVAFRGNRYSTPPEMVSDTVNVVSRLGSAFIDITTSSGIVIARHDRAADGAGAVVRDHVHVTALDHAAMAAATSAAPHRRKQRIPPGPTALAAAAALTGTTNDAADTVTDLAAYARAAQGRNTLP